MAFRQKGANVSKSLELKAQHGGGPGEGRETSSRRRPYKTVSSAIAALAVAAVALAACGTSSKSVAASAKVSNTTDSTMAASGTANSKVVALDGAMRTLWDQHMEWTYATVDAFFHDPAALQPTLNRLLQNQRDIGAAIVPFYGQAAGTQLTNLLLTHIEDAVPVLKAAQANNSAQLASANSAWYANAKQIADFLSAANPSNWPQAPMEEMMKTHITQTITYSVDLLKGDYAQAVTDYGLAESHMGQMADMLTAGIVAQYPNDF